MIIKSVEWSSEEITFIKQKVKEKIHPIDFIDELNKEFENNRTLISIANKLGRLTPPVSYAHCEPKKSQEAREELEKLAKSEESIIEMPPKKVDLIVEKDRDIQRLKTQLGIVQRKYTAANKAANLQESIIGALKESISALPVVKVPTLKSFKVERTKETALLLLSDLHAGEVVKLDETGGINSYNFDIMKQRLKYLANSIIDISSNKLRGYTFPKLVVGALGDFVTGIIHEELVESAENTPIEWSEGTALVIAQFLLELAQVFPEIEFTGVVGNHGRMTKKVRYKKRYVNWDYITYTTLGLLLRNQKNIKFNLPRSFWTLQEIEGKNFLFLHGDNIQSWAGIPWYGIQRMVARFTELLSSKRIMIDYVCLGHFHNAGTLDKVSGEIILNGSVIGGSEFSIGKLFLSADAKQIFAGVHKRQGLSWRYHLNLQNTSDLKDPYVYEAYQSIVDQADEVLEK